VRRLDQQLRKTHFVADPATLEELVRDLVAMEPNGILGLVGIRASTSRSAWKIDRHALLSSSGPERPCG
jgi:hypothetical protein